MSPEVLEGSYDKRCDLWSMGVVAYRLLTGEFPFTAATEEELEEKILSCDYVSPEGVSRSAKAFIEGLIEPNVERRMTCE